MNTPNKVLAGLAVAQIVLCGLTWMPRGDGASEPRDLLGFPVDQIASITIHGRTSKDEVAPKPAVLTRTEGGAGWVLTSSDGFPAADANVQPLLEALGKLTVRNPIAVNEESQASLEVAPDAHTRKLEIVAKDGTKRVLFFGAAQGQTSHVRVDGEVETYDVKGVSAWSLANTDNRYFDRDGFVKVDPDKVRSVTIERPGQAPIELAKAADAWTLVGSEATPLDPAATRTFVQTLLTVRMLEPAGKERKPEYGLEGGTVVKWTVEEEGGATASHEYRVGADVAGENGRKYAVADTSPFVVKVLASNVKHATEEPVDKLLDQPLELPE